MISVAEALTHVFALADRTGEETVDLRHGAGRVLARAVVATRAQPPFDASAMDGYAVAGEVAPGARFRVIGESAAGGAFAGRVGTGEAVRIFTGAPVPEGATRVVIQEDVTADGGTITVRDRPDAQDWIRPAGQDFTAGDRIEPGRRLSPADLALAAAMGAGRVVVALRPQVALIATGNELVLPGETPGPGQIYASNTFGLAAMVEAAGGVARILPIARDTEASIRFCLDLASDADLIVTIGGASVGDHDLVGAVAAEAGLDRAFYKIAMRPGKPLMAGRLNGTPMLGLPGNPVSSMVCGHIFLRPLLAAMQGLPARALPRTTAPLARAIAANGPREHYMRAQATPEGILVAERQDSGLLGVLARADRLVVRPPSDPARAAGDTVEVIEV